MPRQARVVAAGAPHHITQRDNNRQDVFLFNEDRRRYLDALHEQCLRHNVTLLGWCFPVGNQEPLRMDCGQGSSHTPSPGRKRGVNPAILPA